MSSSGSLSRNLLLPASAVLLAVLFWPAFTFAWYKWETDPNYGHGFFVPLAAGYLVWRKRDALKSQTVKPSAMGFAFVLPAVMLHIMADNAGLYRFSMIAFVAALAGMTVIFFGWASLKQISFPLVFLLLAVPIPLFLESTTLPLKLMASKTAVDILAAFGLSIHREGTIIYLPNTTLEVAAACSGLRSLVLVCTVGAFYAYTARGGWRRRCILFLASIPIALGANVTRIIATAVLWNYADAESLRKFTHDFSGIFVFVVAGALFVVTGAIVDAIADARPAGGAKPTRPKQDTEACPTS